MAEFPGNVDVLNSANNLTIRLDGQTGNLQAGGNGQGGDMVLYKSGSSSSDFGNPTKATLHLDSQGNARLGGNGQDGDLGLFQSTSTAADVGNFDKSTIHLDGEQGNIRLGGNSKDGDIALYRAISTSSDFGDFNKAAIHLDGDQGNVLLGGNGIDGDLLIFPTSATDHSDWSKAVIHLNGGTGDISLSGADCAERFDLVKDATVDAGAVLVMGQAGALEPCGEAYDKRVAGVVSGAGTHRPGLILDAGGRQEGRAPVALMGKVFCKVDASAHPIEVGDLLTTSKTPGHAMKVTDATKAFGAVIGKAMRAQPSGKGMIPILVCLQ